MSVKKSVNVLECFGASSGGFLKNGRLIPAYKASLCGVCPKNVTFAAYSRLIKKFIFVTDGTLYESDDGLKFRDMCSYGAAAPFMVEGWRNGVTQTVVIAGNIAATYFDNSFLAINLAVSLSGGVMHCGRLFGADAEDGLLLRWSGASSITGWGKGLNESGHLKLDPERGDILNLILYNGKLVAVRQYGLTVLSMYGSPENFSVDITDTDCDAIFKNTACVVAGKLCFYSASGLKCFDGTKISPMDIRHKISQPVNCAEYEGKYFLACKNCILCVDLSCGESCVIDAGADFLFVKDGVYFCNAQGLNRLEEGGKYVFESRAVDFGTGRLKTVTKIDVRGTADIRISNGVHTRIFTGASGVVHPHLRGKNFIVKAEGESAVEGIIVYAEVTDAI